MSEQKPQSWYFWPVMIAVTALVTLAACFIVDGISYDHEPAHVLDFAGMILSTAFAALALMLVVRLARIPFLHEHWESTTLAAVMATIGFVAVAGKSSWGAGLGLGFIGVAVVVVRYIVSKVSDE